MARYIDMDKLKEMIEAKADTLIDGKEAFFYIANWLDLLPTADVVEVVRCKDCEYLLKDLSDRQAHLCMKNPFCRMNVKLDDFCSKGERKEGD